MYIYSTLRSNDFIDDFIKIFDTFEKTKNKNSIKKKLLEIGILEGTG